MILSANLDLNKKKLALTSYCFPVKINYNSIISALRNVQVVRL